ncbi:protein sprouty homolog 1-like [Saccoglossus kowalevskii]|nr:PREDICTED: protein sprouty homolog 2-like isoform X1 [Saccoglossus kowalevskii]XP_006822864.1 PREDICTED: protein sprouty homolog 2-like isoform X3 [Saccoglossus kowalevskii]XP_006822865.1 PREDICTED: protein sprouty homolog 2-like isoform X4 [Saccoglossus kowalevskii]XP_006822866.1 PREDICTED: protein sprouty homolog 2-like isoform X5 [Saccoglossus kowalevskii]
MARRQNDGLRVVESQPRSIIAYNNSIYNPLNCTQLKLNQVRAIENDYTDHLVWEPNVNNRSSSRPSSSPTRKAHVYSHLMFDEYYQSAKIPTGQLKSSTLVTTNGYNSTNGTVIQVVRSPPSFNKPVRPPPPKIPTSNWKSHDTEKTPPELSPRPDLVKERPTASHGHDQKSILICPFCGLCKCAGCKSSKELPEKWLCDGRCLLSAESAVDYGSCLCAVKGTFYHCSSCVANEDEDYGCSDNPCLCSKPGENHCCTRWITMGLMSMCFPCLVCYLPGKLCVRMCRACYGGTHHRGCRCPPRVQEQLNHLL